MRGQGEAIKARSLEVRYICVYLDATYISLNAIPCPNKPSILLARQFKRSPGLYSSSHGIGNRLKRVLQDLKECGFEEMLLFIANGLKSMTGRIFLVFPNAMYQACCVPLSRGITAKSVADYKEICNDFKSVYRAEKQGTRWRGAESLYRQMEKHLSQSDEIVGFESIYIFHLRWLSKIDLAKQLFDEPHLVVQQESEEIQQARGAIPERGFLGPLSGFLIRNLQPELLHPLPYWFQSSALRAGNDVQWSIVVDLYTKRYYLFAYNCWLTPDIFNLRCLGKTVLHTKQ